MSIKNQWLFNVVMVLLAWLSLPILGINNLKRFLPASVLVVLLESLNVRVGKNRDWWVFYSKPKSYISGELPFHLGPFLVGAMWILKWTYGNLPGLFY